MRTGNYQLKKAQANNLKDIQNLLEECKLPNEDISGADLEHYFIIENDREIIGSIGLEPFSDYGLLRSLAIVEEYRQEGHGKRLVQKLESYATKLEIRSLYLLTTTADSYFSMLGYQRTSRDQTPKLIQSSEEFANICPSKAILIKKNLL